MTPFGALIWAKQRIAVHTIASVRGESKLKVTLVSAAAVAMWFGLFRMSQLGFRLFETFFAEILGDAGLSFSDLVMSRLLASFAFALLVLLTFSNLLVSYATLYRSREMPYLVQSPVPVATLFLGRFVECVSFSSWASAFLGSPLLLAYGIETAAPWTFYPAVVLFFLPFVIIPAALGTAATLLLVRVVAGHRRRVLPALAALVAVAVALFILTPERVDPPNLADPSSLAGVVQAMGSSQHPLLPSQWLAGGVFAAATGDLAEAGFSLLLLASNAALLLWLATLLAERVFYPGWSDLLGADEQSGPKPSHGGIFSKLDGLTRWLPEPYRSLVAKDVRTFWREPTQWSQFLLLFGIMALYLANMRGDVAAIDRATWQAWGTLLNLAASMLILASLTSRFIYPLISLEGRRIWILGLAPLTMRQLVRQKYWFSVSTTAFFTLGLATLSSLRLDLDAFELAVSLGTVAATTFALSGLAVGLGALYPNFEEDNPSRVVSGLGGTLNFFLSMLYILVVTGLLAVVLLTARLGSISDGAHSALTAACFAVVLGLTLVATWLPLRLGMRHLETMEL
ncbi:MAG: hypothetical protein MPN21_19425 [Thermoanaerobaculia bacterium]|nr:hypothetical protein [Thermoanaerobaculia bacterium]